jgi:lysozyme family protein
MRENWDKAFDEVIKYEGGYVNNPRDPGGPTNLGITQATLSRWLGRAATVAEVKALTREKVKPIYKRYFWDVIKGDALPGGVDFATYDFAVNSGPSRAARYLQSVVGVKQDGKIGPATIAAVNRYSAQDVVKKLVAKRRGFLMGLKTWRTFGKGWNRRMVSVQQLALRLAPPTTGVAFAGLSGELAPDNPVEDYVEVTTAERDLNQQTGDQAARAQLVEESGPVGMFGTKSLLTSKTFWANTIGFIAVLPVIGKYLADVDISQLGEAVAGAIAAGAFIASTVARIYAKYQIAAR